MSGPVACSCCGQRAALIGVGNPRCEVCTEADSPKTRRRTTQAMRYAHLSGRQRMKYLGDPIEDEGEDQRLFERDHDWASDNGDLNEGRAVGPAPGYDDKW